VVVTAFAIWTVLCNVTVLFGGSLVDLLRMVAGGLLVVAALALRRRRPKSKAVDGPETPPPVGPPIAAAAERGFAFRGAAPIGAVLATVLYAATGNFLVFWLMGLTLLTAGLIRGVGSHRRLEPPLERRSWQISLWTLCALCAGVTLLAQKPEFDDGGNLLVAVIAADQPEATLFGPEFHNGLPNLPAAFLIYKVHSLEVLEGALSYLTKRPVLDIAHVVIPPLAAFLVPLVFANLFRLLIPRRWIWGLVVLMFLLFMMGDTHQSYGNFAFIRLQQGKAIFLTLVVPLLMVYGLAFALQPSSKRWWMLVAAQIACVGLSSPALWIAPLVAALALVCGLDGSRRSLRIFLIGISSSVYLVLLAAGMWLRLHGTVDTSTTMTSAELMRDALEKVLGDGPMSVLSLLAVLGAWTVAKAPIERRVALVFPLAFLLAWNPLWAKSFAESVTHPLVYWRVFWILPLPVLLALLSTAPIEAEWAGWFRRAPYGLRIGVTLGASVAVFYALSEVSTLSAENRVRWAPPYWKVPREEFAAACSLVEHAPARASVLAPNDVTTWITTLHEHPRPLVIRTHLTQMAAEA
jgi:hypothetical protein